jgi:gamma-glutamylputrescine oxidase
MFKPSLSYWEKMSFFKDIDYTIIGSGIVGLNAAIFLKKQHPNSNVIILEKGMLPSGASTRNAGFACFGSISELLDDLEYMTEDEVLELVEKRWAGLQRLLSLTGEKLCYDECGGYELFREDNESSFKTCVEKIDYVNNKLATIIGRKSTYQLADSQINRFGFRQISHLILNTAEGHIDTGEMMKKLLEVAIQLGVKIYNGATVKHYEEQSNGIFISLDDGREIMSQKMLIATNGFAKNLLKGIDLVPARNQVLITKPIPNLHVKGTFHYDEGYYYFRNVGDRILFGGGRNLSPLKEQTDRFGTTELIQDNLLKMLKEIILPQTNFEVDMWWSGILGVGKTKRPIIKSISNNIAVAVRMGGMGVAIGSLVGEEGGRLIH